jgi:hypothetical protein
MAAKLQGSYYNLETGDVTATCCITVQGQAFNLFCIIPVDDLAARATADGRDDWSMTDVAVLASGLIGQTVDLP